MLALRKERSFRSGCSSMKIARVFVPVRNFVDRTDRNYLLLHCAKTHTLRSTLDALQRRWSKGVCASTRDACVWKRLSCCRGSRRIQSGAARQYGLRWSRRYISQRPELLEAAISCAQRLRLKPVGPHARSSRRVAFAECFRLLWFMNITKLFCLFRWAVVDSFYCGSSRTLSRRASRTRAGRIMAVTPVTRYSNASQIDRSNVTQLKVAWTYRTGPMTSQ
jgi:hypothetical protein